jgi:pseudouridine kinase
VFDVVCIGAAHVDRRGRAWVPVARGESIPVRLRTTHGGVARNVAEGLGRMGLRVAMAGLVGADADGEAVRAALAPFADVSALAAVPDAPTASYTALLEPDGTLAVALADMGIYDDGWGPVLDAAPLGRAAWTVLDANPPADVLGAAAARAGRTRLAANATSAAKARRLSPILPRLDVLFANRAEAAALTGRTDPAAAAAALAAAGVRLALVTCGAAGVVAADAGGASRFAAPPADVADETGAGDAFAAGVLYGLVRGADAADAVRLGLAAAALAVADAATVPAALADLPALHLPTGPTDA